MIITFNQRELLEFSNWNINQSKLPRYFVISDMDEKINEVKIILNRRFNEGWDVDNSPKQNGSFLLIRMDKKTDSHPYRHSNFISKQSVGTPEITGEEFIKGIVFENIPYVTTEDVEQWLEHEKHIKRLPILMSSSN